MTKGIYVLHFNEPVKYDKANQYGDSQHYVGQAEDIEHRVYQHVSSDGAEMTKAAAAQGIGLRLSAVFPGDSSSAKEKLVQNNVKTLCVICLMAPKVKIEPEKKKTEVKVSGGIKSIAQIKADIDRVEWATPFQLRFKNNCERCGKYMAANTQGAKVSGDIICLGCVKPEERGNRLAHLA